MKLLRSNFRLTSMVVLLAYLLLTSAPVSATIIDYSLDGDWIYEAENPATLSLSDNTVGGININISVPEGIEEGGLTASRHDLPEFSLEGTGFIELHYGSYLSFAEGTSDAEIHLAVEFFDAEFNHYELGIAHNGTSFLSWFLSEDDFNFNFEGLVPAGLSTVEGALGLSWQDDDISAYFTSTDGTITNLFSSWDISDVIGANSFSVDNDFESSTEEGGSVEASVNFKKVVYSPGSSATVPEPSSIVLILVGLLSLAYRRYRFG